MRLLRSRWGRLLIFVLVGTALLIVMRQLAGWSRGEPAVRFQPGDQTVMPGKSLEWTFDTDAVGGLPVGAEALSGAWIVQSEPDAPTPPNVLCQTARGLFPSLSLSDNIYTDVEVSAHFKPLSGVEDQAAGIIFRVQDEDNYYIFRANALENNVMFFLYAGGKRSILKRASEPIASGRWQQMRVMVFGNRFRGFLEDKLVLETTDDTFSAGKVGLWTKADSVTCFDNVRVLAR